MKGILTNNHGDISITVLVIGVFLVCVVAMASFLYADTKFANRIFGLNLAEQVSSDVEQFYAYVQLGYSCNDAASLIGVQYDSTNRVLIVKKILKENQGFWNKEEVVLLDITRTVFLDEGLCS